MHNVPFPLQNASMFHSILIANRGEIASRIMQTAKKLGMRTIAVYSEADTNALHVKNADEAVFIGASPSIKSYLNIDNLISAIDQSGAECVHPGYGFLSEKENFARAVVERTSASWVGPTPEHHSHPPRGRSFSIRSCRPSG